MGPRALVLLLSIILPGLWITPAPASTISAPAIPPVGHYAELNGIRMYYEDQGSGRPLLLLHGGAGNGAQFEKQTPFFAKHFRVIVPDACAQGRTSDRPDSLTYHAMAEDVVALLDRLKIKTADIMGWSDGGVTGLDLAIHHPDRLRHLVTFGANFRADGLNAPDIAWNLTATAASFGGEMKGFYERLAPDPTHYEVAMNRIIALWRTQPNFTPEELHRIRARVLIGAGEHDVVRQDHSEELARLIPGATLWIVPDASHSVIQEKPELVNRTVLEFLRK